MPKVLCPIHMYRTILKAFGIKVVSTEIMFSGQHLPHTIYVMIGREDELQLARTFSKPNSNNNNNKNKIIIKIIIITVLREGMTFS